MFSGRRCGRAAESGTTHDGVLLPGDDEREEAHDRAQLPGVRRAARLLEAMPALSVLHEQSLCQHVRSVHAGGTCIDFVDEDPGSICFYMCFLNLSETLDMFRKQIENQHML